MNSYITIQFYYFEVVIYKKTHPNNLEQSPTVAWARLLYAPNSQQ